MQRETTAGDRSCCAVMSVERCVWVPLLSLWGWQGGKGASPGRGPGEWDGGPAGFCSAAVSLLSRGGEGWTWGGVRFRGSTV